MQDLEILLKEIGCGVLFMVFKNQLVVDKNYLTKLLVGVDREN